MKFVDYKCPNCGGSVKFEKGNSTGFCENCGATLQVETETTDKLFRAFDLISVNRFVTATELINEVLSVDVKNGQAYLGLLLCDTESTSPLHLATTKYSFINNPNYIRALDFLPENQRNELIALCNQNPANNNSSIVRPNEAMKELARLNGIIIAKGFTAVQLYYGSDFSTKDESVVIQFYHETTEHMEKMISLYNTLNDEQKKQITNFSITEFEGAVDTYLQIKEIVSTLPESEAENEDVNTEDRSVEEILADESISLDTKLCELATEYDINYIDQLRDHADKLDWYIYYALPEKIRDRVLSQEEADFENDAFYNGLSDFMYNCNHERLDAFCSEMEKISEDVINSDRFLTRCNLVAHIWKNRPREDFPTTEKFANKAEYLKCIALKSLSLYKYIVKLYILEEKYIEALDGEARHFVDLNRQFELISILKVAYGIDECYLSAPKTWYSEDWSSEQLNKVFVKEFAALENKIELNYEKAVLEYELGGLGLFNASRKKEIKTRIAEIDKTISNDRIAIELATLENSLQNTTVSLYNLTYEKDIVDKAKADFDATPFTAFGRRKELKQKYQSLNEQYLAKKTAYENQIKTLTTEIEKIKKTIK